MRILFFTDAFLPHAGGARVYYYEIYRRLAADFGHEISIVTTRVPGWQQFDARESAGRFQVTRRHTPLSNWKVKEWPRLVPAVCEALFDFCRIRPHAVHFGDLFPQGVVCLLLRKVLGIDYLAYCHGEEITQTDLRRYQPYVRNAIYRNARIVVAASEFARVNLMRIGVTPERIVKVTPGVDCERFHPQPKSQVLLRRHALDGKRVLLTVSRLVPRKGHTVVLHALARLRPIMPDLRYVIVGTGPHETALRELAAALGVAHAVVFAGYVPADELPDYYNLCDVFVLPNFMDTATGDTEGFGMVFIEANAAAKPVIAGKDGGTYESVLDGVTGLRIDPADVDELAVKIRLLLDNEALRHRLGENGRNRATTHFEWSQAAAAVNDLLECQTAGARAQVTSG